MLKRIKRKKYIILFVFVVNMKNLGTLKNHLFLKNREFFLYCSTCGSKDEEIFKEEESIVILIILDLINNLEEYQNKYD